MTNDYNSLRDRIAAGIRPLEPLDVDDTAIIADAVLPVVEQALAEQANRAAGELNSHLAVLGEERDALRRTLRRMDEREAPTCDEVEARLTERAMYGGDVRGIVCSVMHELLLRGWLTVADEPADETALPELTPLQLSQLLRARQGELLRDQAATQLARLGVLVPHRVMINGFVCHQLTDLGRRVLAAHEQGGEQ